MATPYYSGTIDDLKRILKTLNIGSGTLDDLQTTNVEASQADIDQKIDSFLSNIYYTPLKQIVRSGVTKYPDPIPEIARRMVCADLILNTLVDIDTSVVGTAQGVIADARRELFELGSKLVGSTRLEGQREKTRNHFVPPGIAPASDPTPMA